MHSSEGVNCLQKLSHGVRVNTGYVNSSKGTSSERLSPPPSGVLLPFQTHSATHLVRTRQNQGFLRKWFLLLLLALLITMVCTLFTLVYTCYNPIPNSAYLCTPFTPVCTVKIQFLRKCLFLHSLFTPVCSLLTLIRALFTHVSTLFTRLYFTCC